MTTRKTKSPASPQKTAQAKRSKSPLAKRRKAAATSNSPKTTKILLQVIRFEHARLMETIGKLPYRWARRHIRRWAKSLG